MAIYYCKYCGMKYFNVMTLTMGKCPKHPSGTNKGNHALYEGGEKDEYVCKFCGKRADDIRSLTDGYCSRHPNGAFKAHHEPAL